MNNSMLEAEEWVWLKKEKALELLSLSQDPWPFKHVTIDQVYSLTDALSIQKNLQWVLRIIGTTIPGTGVVFTLLLICTLWKKATVKKNTFFLAMLIIAFLDLIFNIFDFVYNVCYRDWKVNGYTSYNAMWAICWFKGVVYSISLASDICASCLTIERYLAIGKPQFYQNLSKTVKRNVWTVVLSLIFLLSITRMHYTMDFQVQPIGSLYVYTQSPMSTSKFAVGLAMFSDVVIPFVLVSVMSVISTRFRMVVMKREKNKVAPKAAVLCSNVGHSNVTETHIQTIATTVGVAKKELQPESQNRIGGPQSIIVLTLALDVFLILGNLGYCLYFVAELLLAKHGISYDSNYEEMSTYCAMQRLEGFAAVTLVTIECSTRAMNFPVYMTLSGTMRKEFRDFVKKIF